MCLDAIQKAKLPPETRIVVLDNNSTDRSCEIAAKYQCEVVRKKCTQPEALSWLLAKSDAEFTLLIHADVMLLNPNWFSMCRSHTSETCILVSPEDIGCGPFTRPFGQRMPESSFMFFLTESAKRISTVNRGGRLGRWLRRREFDFFGPHVTHRIPELLARFHKTWKPLNVLMSPISATPVYSPTVRPMVWSDEMSILKYGLGNFYALDGEVTHYHNWYDRISAVPVHSGTGTIEQDGKGFSVDYIRKCSANFKSDYWSNTLDIPDAATPPRIPRLL